MNMLRQPVLLLRLIVASCYMALGAYLFVNPSLIYFVRQPWSYVLAALISAYGAFRLWRLWMDMKDQQED
ncbi:MAG: hypothetical protein U0T84_08635 [Chitinophagales bacterium]